MDTARLTRGIAGRRALGQTIFDELRRNTSQGEGICRPSYSKEEDFAHRLLGKSAAELGFEVSRDAAANTYMTFPGRDRQAPKIVIGSHLDSVEAGGNYDGAAGVVAGLVAIAGLKDSGFTPSRDIAVMGIRAEESAWFNVSYIGSRSALGVLPASVYDTAKRIDTDRVLSEHMTESGGNPKALQQGRPPLPRDSLHAYLEVHIEQGPRLVAERLPVGIVEGIPGNFRHPEIVVSGGYGHVGSARQDRRDAVIAASAFVTTLDRLWEETLGARQSMGMTVGRFFTDAAHHALTKVSGRVELSLDVRSTDPVVLKGLQTRVHAMAREIAEAKRVTIDMGRITHAEVGVMDKTIVEALGRGAKALSIPHMHLPSPASHDAAAFAAAGVPTAMIFVRNDHGSHNPREHMEMDDFMQATSLLGWWLATTGAA
ncbi:MAG: hydantoinase/carbamoylase family amidase [Alphaproteobacteria bacterium]